MNRAARRLASAVALLPCLLVGCGGRAARPNASLPPAAFRGSPAEPPSVHVRAAHAITPAQLVGFDWHGPSSRRRQEPLPSADLSLAPLRLKTAEPLTLDVRSAAWPTAVELRWFLDTPSQGTSPVETQTCRPPNEGPCRFASPDIDAVTTVTVTRTRDSRRARWLVIWASWYVRPGEPRPSTYSEGDGEDFGVWMVPVAVA